MEYKELVELGFVRRNYEDSVHEDRYGYKPFDLMFEKGNVSMSWSPLKINEVHMFLNERHYTTFFRINEVEHVMNCFK